MDYSVSVSEKKQSFYEGKKATPADIASGVPVRRTELENSIIESIHHNTVTVIKASSGQGKTTLALQAAYILQQEYKTYQLLWCDDVKEIGNIIQYFKMRIEMGEKILILLDNLDNHLGKWNELAQLLQSELQQHYKLLITTREIDWYNYCGDLSNVQSVKIIKPILDKKEAIEIFNLFRDAKQLHPDITSWEKAWNKLADQQLLIEYVYLLTHGEMLSERIAAQISEIGRSHDGKAKCEILRKVCFADLCGVRLSIAKLYTSQYEMTDTDFGELLKGMESEFFVQTNTVKGYVEGLHPIRSKHIVDKLHEFFPIDHTAISVIQIAEKTDFSILFSHLPEFEFDAGKFFCKVVDVLWNEDDLSNYITAIQGIFSGSVMKYYLANQAAFNDANAHGGLFFVAAEKCPFTEFKEFGVSTDTLDKMREILPENKNIQYLCELRDSIPSSNLKETYVYVFCLYLYKKLLCCNYMGIKDKVSYAAICDWLYTIDTEFNLSHQISLNDIWSDPESLTLEAVSTLMYISYCGNQKLYMEFIGQNICSIFLYLKHQTKSHRIFTDPEKNAIHIEYILRWSNIKEANEQSVTRLKYICRTLPIYDLYCADALKPKIDALSSYMTHDDAHKEMPVRNIVIMFHQNLSSLWIKTIQSNYEFDTTEEWINHWFDVRELICLLVDKCCVCIYKILEGKKLGSLAGEIDQLRNEFSQMTIGERLYPKENRPFKNKASIPQGLGKLKRDYFQSIQNFMNQFAGFLRKAEQDQRLAMYNLTMAVNNLLAMQNYFTEISCDFECAERNANICVEETRNIEQLVMCCNYYQKHLPDQCFDKYQIKSWYEKNRRKQRKVVEEGLLQLQSRYIIHFPDQSYMIKALNYYPIIVEKFDMTSASSLQEWFLEGSAFADSIFDYLVILSADEPGKVKPIAMQVSRQMFTDIKKAIESEDNSLFENMALPYPVDVTQQMLNCFTQKYELMENKSNDLARFPVGDIAEELWAYSKSVELLIEPEDEDYLERQKQIIRENVRKMLDSLKNKISSDDIDWLTEICDEVFKGKRFADEDFNSLIEDFNRSWEET